MGAWGREKPVVQPDTQKVHTERAIEGSLVCSDIRLPCPKNITSIALRASCSIVTAGRGLFSWAANPTGVGKDAPSSSVADVEGSSLLKIVAREPELLRFVPSIRPEYFAG
jgi:hypothetical protein